RASAPSTVRRGPRSRRVVQAVGRPPGLHRAGGDMSIQVQITGVSPHTEQYPVLSDDEIQVLAADIAENGLFDPITVTSDGVLLDGRNRLRACEIAGVEPRIDIYDGDESQIGAFVRSKNRRRHQPTGSRAMSEALSLHLDGKRKNGKWAYGSLTNDQNSDRSANRAWMVALANAGLVLDHAPALAQEVVDGHLALDAAYRKALSAKDESDRRAADEANAERYEAEAKADLEESAPEYLAKVEDGTYDSHRTARAVWLEHDRAAKRERETREREYRESLQRDANR